MPADQRLEQHARPAACRGCSPRRARSRPVTSTVTPAGRPAAATARISTAPLLRSTPRAAGQVDLLERRVPVARDVGGLPVEKNELVSAPGIRRRHPRHRGAYGGNLGHVAARGGEDDDIRRPHAGAEGLQGLLAGLVGRLTWDGGALEPARGQLPGCEAAEHREQDPRADHHPPVAADYVRQTSEPRFLVSGTVGKDGAHRRSGARVGRMSVLMSCSFAWDRSVSSTSVGRHRSNGCG